MTVSSPCAPMAAISHAARRVHLLTSPWMLVPAARAGPVLCVLLCLTCAASLVHWSWYRLGSLPHRIDTALAGLTIVYVVATGDAAVRALAACALGVFAGGRAAARHEEVKFGVHALFRFLAFWACCVHTQDVALVSTVSVWLSSVFFVVQVCVVYGWYAFLF